MCTYNRHQRAWPHKLNRSDKDCWSEGSVNRKQSVSCMNQHKAIYQQHETTSWTHYLLNKPII